MSRNIALLFILLAAAALRISNLDAQSIWLDEATSLFIAEKSLSDIIGGVGFDRHTPPAYYIILHFWLKLSGSSAIALRAFSVLFDVLNVLLIWQIASRLLGGRAGFFAAGLSCLSPYLIFYAQEGRMYSLLLFLVLLTTQIVVSYRGRNLSLIGGLLLVVVGIIGMYTHYYYALFFAAISIAVLLEDSFSSSKSIYWCLISAIIGLAFIPWIQVILSLIGSGGQTFRTNIALILPYSFIRFVIGYGVMPLVYGTKEDPLGTLLVSLPILLGPLVLFATVSFFGLWRMITEEKRSAAFIVLPLILPGIVAALISLKVPMLSERYLIVSYPFFIILLVYGLLQLRASEMGALLCLTTFVYGYTFQLINPQFGNTNWRAAVEFIEQHSPDTAIVISPVFADDCIRRNSKLPDKKLFLSASAITTKPDKKSSKVDEFWLVERADQKEKFELFEKLGFQKHREEFYPKGNGLRVALLSRKLSTDSPNKPRTN